MKFDTPEQTAFTAAVHRALDLGVNLFDSSDAYWGARHEVLLARALKGRRSDVFITTKAQGMGLGLAICRTIIDKHGGTLTASSDGKSGAAFQIVLPIEPVASTTSHSR